MTYRADLNEQADRLVERNRSIKQLETVHTIVKDTSQGIIEAETRRDVERIACAALADSPLFEYVRIGDYDPIHRSISPSSAAPTDREYRNMMVGDEATDEVVPATTAARRREPVVREDICGDPPLAKWQDRALRNGFQSVLSVPLVYNDSLSSTVTMYSSDADTFDTRTRSTLGDLGREIAHAINAYETKEALISDEVTELELVIRDDSLTIARLASEFGTAVSFEGIVPRTDGPARLYFTVHDQDRSAVENVADRMLTLQDLHHVTEHADDQVFACTVDSHSFFDRLLDHGGVPTEVEVTSESTSLSVELPKEASVRSFRSMLDECYRGVDVLAHRSREPRLRMRSELEKAFEKKLTDSQKEIVRTAYYSGFFESPRESTGQELAEQLDVSQPTITEHIRTAARELFALLFEQDDP
jgi:predicted DNA binding protein